MSVKWSESRRVFFAAVLFLACLQSAEAVDHYSFEHAEEMRLSGRIEWRDYGPEPFLEAAEENKPVFLLLTAPSWCYWCHVYTSDDYVYHPDVYPGINEKFIPVYVDADKRQDLTRKYLEGGWPSTTLLSPGGERLYGYSGPRPVENMIANLELAADFVDSQSFSTPAHYGYQPSPAIVPVERQLKNFQDDYARLIILSYDPVNGGFGRNQKFPQGLTLDFALEFYESTGNDDLLEIVQNTLNNQYTRIEELETNYNLFDPVEGGFHRYGTRSDWTPPHYEKMLYDNVRLLRTYSHLLELAPDNLLAAEVTEKTNGFIMRNWWDEEGGFYGNSDVHGEDEYYALAVRSEPGPRVEKTKYSDWNAEAILTYLYLWQSTQSAEYRNISEKSLDFFSENGISATGAYHYVKSDGEQAVTGSLLDNAYLLLAFTEGYEVLGKEEYLTVSEKLADYSLDSLYDWNSGGFFERNSADVHLYVPGENVDFSKPSENGVMAYALLKLYKITGNVAYLNAGLKSLGTGMDGIPGLDGRYYYAKAAQFAIRNNLLAEFERNKERIEKIESSKQENFWANSFIAPRILETPEKFVPSQEGVEKPDAPLWLLIPVALLAGLLSFLSPCSLPIAPAYLAYTLSISRRSAKKMTIAFFIGLSVTFSLLGMSATLIGTFLKSHLTFFSQIAGIAVMLFGAYVLSGRGFSGLRTKRQPASYLGGVAFGAAFALSWTPCAGPVLITILVIASTASSVASGGLLLFVYGAGLALPMIAASVFIGKINRKSRVWKLIEGRELYFIIMNRKFSLHTNSLISGILFIILGYLIFSGTLFWFSQYITETPFQKYLLSLERLLLGFLR